MIEEELDRASGQKLPDQPWHLPSNNLGRIKELNTVKNDEGEIQKSR